MGGCVEAVCSQAVQVQTQKLRLPASALAKVHRDVKNGCCGGVQQNNRASFHRCGNSLSHLPGDDDGAGNHGIARTITAVARNGNQTTAHGAPGFVPRVSMNQYFAACNAFIAAAVNGACIVARVARHNNTAASHFSAQPVGRISFTHDVTGNHAGAQVHAGIAFDSHGSAVHAGSDQLYT